MSTINDLLLRFRASRETLQEVEHEKRADQEAVIAAYRKAKVTQHEIPMPAQGVIVKGTLVEATELRIDMDTLWDELTPKQRKLIEEKVVSKALLEAAVLQGDIPAELVEKHTEEHPKAPYIRVTERKMPAKKAARKKVKR